MSPPKNRVPRAARPWSWLAGILAVGLLVAGVLALAMVLWDHVDMQALTRAPQVDDRPAPEARAPVDPARPAVAFRVHLYASPASEGFYPDSTFLPGQYEAWTRRVESLGGEVERIQGVQAVQALGGEGVVLVASAVCLSEEEVQALYRHSSRGGHLLMTGATGARDEACEWQGWSALRDLSRGRDVRQVESRPGVYLTLPGDTPLSMGIPPATRLEMRWDAQVAVETEGPRAYWSDWAMNPAPADGTTGVDAAAHLVRDAAGGRIAWFGFHGGEGVDARDQELANRVLANGLLWVAGVPQAALAPWPERARAALVMSQQVGWEFENAAHLVRVGREAEVPVTFFVTSRLALDHPELAEILKAGGEVASRSVDDRELAGLAASEQRTRMTQSHQQVEAWTGAEPLGFRPPGEALDMGIIAGWREVAGEGAYVAGLTGGRTGSPEIVDTDQGPVVVLPRVLKDDYNVVVQDRVTGSAGIARGLFQGVDKVRALGGLALVTTHSQITGSARQVEALRQLLELAREQEGWWFATGGEVAGWTLAASGLTVSASAWDPEEDRLVLEVELGGSTPLEGGWIDVVLPEDEGPWAVRVGGQSVPFALVPMGVSLPLPPLAPGDRIEVVVERWIEGREAATP